MKQMKRHMRVICWVLLLAFFFSMEGVTVFAQDIIDTPDAQTGYGQIAPTPAPEEIQAQPLTEISGSGTDSKRYYPQSGDQIAKEKLQLPPDKTGLVVVDNFEYYNIPDIELEGDDRSGPCGPFSMTSSLKGRGKQITYPEVLKAIRPDDFFTAPGEMVDYALNQGFSCKREDNQSVDGLVKMIRETKRSVICMIQTSDIEKQSDGTFKNKTDGIQHWVNILGARVKDGKAISLLMKDSWQSWRGGSLCEMPADEFDHRWKEMVGIYALGLNPHRLTLQIGPAGSATFGDRVARIFEYRYAGEIGAEGVASAYKALGNLVRSLGKFDLITAQNSLTQLVTGLAKTIGGLAGIQFTLLGTGFDKAGTWLSKTGEDLWKNHGILGKIVAIPAMALGNTLQFVGGALKAVGNSIASSVAIVCNVVNSISDGIAKGLKKVFDGAKDLFKKIF